MFAQRMILETDQAGNLPELPKLPPNRKVEAIFLLLEEQGVQAQRRTPHPDIAGKARILGDVFASAPESEWHPQP